MSGAYFFDLDGTLIDSRQGLYLAFRAGLEAIGVKDADDAALAPFLGVPLPEVFAAAKPGLDEDDLETGMDAFREAFEEEGMFIHPLYPGVEDLLRTVRRAGALIWVVTSKPQEHAERILQSAELMAGVDGVVGAGWDETDTKETLIYKALLESGAEPRDTIMLGDRLYDIEGAIANDVFPVGALWGYGSRGELEDAGCTALMENVPMFLETFVGEDA